MNWSFALVNNQLAEIYFEKKKEKIKFLGHCYVKRSEFKTEKEQKWIEEDIAKHQFAYRKGTYKAKSI